jgi:uncharacterized protein YjiS (DUF1127 family)
MIKALIIAYKNHAAYIATYKELNSLSNKELHDLGIDRSDIERVSRESICGDEAKVDFSFFKNLFKVKTEKNKIEEYLAESANLIDLENRLKNVDRGLAPWQIRARNFAQGWAI